MAQMGVKDVQPQGLERQESAPRRSHNQDYDEDDEEERPRHHKRHKRRHHDDDEEEEEDERPRRHRKHRMHPRPQYDDEEQEQQHAAHKPAHLRRHVMSADPGPEIGGSSHELTQQQIHNIDVAGVPDLPKMNARPVPAEPANAPAPLATSASALPQPE